MKTLTLEFKWNEIIAKLAIIILSFVIVFFSLNFPLLSASAQDENSPGLENNAERGDWPTIGDMIPKYVSRQIRGEVGVVRPTYITVIYAYDQEQNKDWEIVVPVGENAHIVGVNGISDINEGDTVEIIFQEKNWVDKEGIGRSEKKATEIKFISPAPKGLRSEERR